MQLPRLSLLTQICITHMISHVYMFVLPVLMPIILITSHNVNFIQIGLAISVFNIVSAIAQTPVGIFVDKLGPKRMLMAGLILDSVTFLSLGFIENYLWLIIAMGIAGVANAVYHPADYAILSQNVHETRMGRAFSLHTFSGFIGFAITPTLMLSIASFGGVSLAFIVTGVIGLLTAMILYPSAKNEPSQHEQQITQLNKIDKSKKTTMILITPNILLMLMLFLLLSLSGGSIQTFSASALVTGYSVSLTDANIALTAFLIGSSVGVLIGGQLADYSQKHGLIAAAALVLTALLALILAVMPIKSVIFIIAIIGFMGFLSGIIAPSRDMLVRNIAPKGSEGRVFGIVSTGFNIGGAVGPLLFGFILDHGHPRGIFWCTAIFMVLTAIIAIFQEMRSQSKLC